MAENSTWALSLIGLLAGRTEETKERLTSAVLELLRTHVKAGEAAVHASAEVRDLDPSYRKYDDIPAAPDAV